MTPDDFFIAFVEENYQDSCSNPGCVRRAFNSAISASHLADHYFNYHKKYTPDIVYSYKKIGDFVNFITKNTDNYFRDIRSIANAYKHLYTGLDARYKKYSSISSTGAIESLCLIDINLEEIFEEFNENINSTNVVIYTRKNGEKIRYQKAIEVVINFWNKHLFENKRK